MNPSALVGFTLSALLFQPWMPRPGTSRRVAMSTCGASVRPPVADASEADGADPCCASTPRRRTVGLVPEDDPHAPYRGIPCHLPHPLRPAQDQRERRAA